MGAVTFRNTFRNTFRYFFKFNFKFQIDDDDVDDIAGKKHFQEVLLSYTKQLSTAYTEYILRIMKISTYGNEHITTFFIHISCFLKAVCRGIRVDSSQVYHIEH